MTSNDPPGHRFTGGAAAPPFIFLLLACLFFQGGDWPPVSFLLRAIPFVLAAAYLVRNSASVIRPTVPDLLVLGWWALEAVSVVRPGYPWVSYQWFLHRTAALLFYGLVRSLAPGPEERFARGAGGVILLGAAAELCIALFQLVAAGGNGRPDGTLSNPNTFAELLVYAGIVAWSWRETTAEGAWVRRAFPAIAAALLAGIVATKSRGGFVLALAIVGYVAVRKGGWRWVLAAAAAAGAAMLVPNPIADRFIARGDPFAYERVAMWKAAFRMFLDHPLGVGSGHFKYYWDAMREPVAGALVAYGKSAQTAHSEFFSVLAEQGVPGAAAFAAAGLAGALSLRAAARSRDAVAGGAALILLASYLHSIVQTNYHIPGLLLVNAGALATVSSRLWPALLEREVRIKGAVRFAGLVLLLPMTAYSAMTLAGAELERLGIRDLSRGRFEEAARRYAQAARVDPFMSVYADSASAARYRLYTMGKGGAYLGTAIEFEMDAALRNPMEYLYAARLGHLYAAAMPRFGGSGDGTLLRSALRSYDAAIALNPHGAVLRYRKAELLRGAGRPAEARAEIEAALRDEPRFARGWAFLGAMLEETDPAGAAAAFGKALALHRQYSATAREPLEREFVDVDPAALERRLGGTGRLPAR